LGLYTQLVTINNYSAVAVSTFYSSLLHTLLSSVYHNFHQTFPGNGFNTVEILQLPWPRRCPLINTPHLNSQLHLPNSRLTAHLEIWNSTVKVKVTLRLAVYRQSVRLVVKPLETHDQNFWNSTDFFVLFIIPRHGPQHRKHSYSFVACIRLRGNAFTQLFRRNSCARHISYRDTSSIVACEHYLATAVSLAPQLLL
jgi:hypothetical protein